MGELSGVHIDRRGPVDGIQVLGRGLVDGGMLGVACKTGDARGWRNFLGRTAAICSNENDQGQNADCGPK